LLARMSSTATHKAAGPKGRVLRRPGRTAFSTGTAGGSAGREPPTNLGAPSYPASSRAGARAGPARVAFSSGELLHPFSFFFSQAVTRWAGQPLLSGISLASRIMHTPGSWNPKNGRKTQGLKDFRVRTTAVLVQQTGFRGGCSTRSADRSLDSGAGIFRSAVGSDRRTHAGTERVTSPGLSARAGSGPRRGTESRGRQPAFRSAPPRCDAWFPVPARCGRAGATSFFCRRLIRRPLGEEAVATAGAGLPSIKTLSTSAATGAACATTFQNKQGQGITPAASPIRHRAGPSSTPASAESPPFRHQTDPAPSLTAPSG
jgi:hypothetical protein